MATLKEHQAAMVDLLANGSGIPASASRLAHAMHDVLEAMMDQAHEESVQQSKDFIRKYLNDRADATTPGLNDKALSKREKAPKTDSPAKWPTPSEQRVKELENTIRQLKTNLVKVRGERDMLHSRLLAHEHPTEQSGCCREDTQLMQECPHSGPATYYGKILRCDNCGAEIPE